MLVLVALGMVILMAAAAFTVDLAYMFLATDQLQIGTDAATKAACTGLSQGYTTARRPAPPSPAPAPIRSAAAAW